MFTVEESLRWEPVEQILMSDDGWGRDEIKRGTVVVVQRIMYRLNKPNVYLSDERPYI